MWNDTTWISLKSSIDFLNVHVLTVGFQSGGDAALPVLLPLCPGSRGVPAQQRHGEHQPDRQREREGIASEQRLLQWRTHHSA